jgi:hypothetical protein
LSQGKVAAQMASAVAAPPGLFVFERFLVNQIVLISDAGQGAALHSGMMPDRMNSNQFR